MFENISHSFVTALVQSDPRGNNVLKTGFDIDLKGLVPLTIKELLYDCLYKRQWVIRPGITVKSEKPIFPIYQGTTVDGYIHFKFPTDLVVTLSDFLVIRLIDIKLTDLMLSVEMNKAIAVIKTWPDVHFDL